MLLLVSWYLRRLRLKLLVSSELVGQPNYVGNESVVLGLRVGIASRGTEILSRD
jgi:hypothetical protein